MYLTPNDKYWIIDIETESLTPELIWVVCAVNYVTREEVTLIGYDQMTEWINARVAEGCKFIGHNIISFDAPVLNRILGTKLTIGMIIDTMIMSMIYFPDLKGGHSLDEWGARLKFPKTSFNQFDRYSPEMVQYCLNDIRLTLRVYYSLVERMRKYKFTDKGLEIEHRAWQLIQKQKKDGFAFNIQGAHELYALLRQKENEIRDKLYEHWPPTIQRVAEYGRPFKKDGSHSANFIRHSEQYQRVEISPCRERYYCYDYVAFNIGSPPQRIEKLLELGWKPREFTEKGSPQPTRKGKLSPSLIEFVEKSGRPEPKLIAQWIEYNSRANMVNTWMEAYNERTGCIHGTLWFANTLRYKHSAPNTANIPAVRIYEDPDKDKTRSWKGLVKEYYHKDPLLQEDGAFTYEARDLWTVRDTVNRRLVGVDAKGIQLRVLAHYLNNPDFTKEVIDGDPHSYNQQIGGFASRAIAKTFIYAFLLGAGDEKVGQIIGGSTRDGKETKERFIGNFPGLKQLLDRLEQQVKGTTRIRLCDGTPIVVQQLHTRLGYLLQGDESRIMKKAMINTWREVNRRKLDVIKVGDIHDEWQNDTLLAHVEEFTQDICPRAFADAGKFFNYNVPIDCDSKVGLTWASTH